MLQSVAGCCRVLQSVALWGNMTQCVVSFVSSLERDTCVRTPHVLQRVAVRCSVLQCVAVWGCVLQCGVVCCSVG